MEAPKGLGRQPYPIKEIDGVEHKYCKKCDTWKTFDKFYWYRGEMNMPCRACKMEYYRLWRTDRRDYYNAYQREYKKRKKNASKALSEGE